MQEEKTSIKGRVWVLQDGEPLPIDHEPRLMRSANLCQKLADEGFEVTWWTSRFNHNLKKYRDFSGPFHEMGPRYRIYLLDGPAYKKNLSLARIRHYRSLGADFLNKAKDLPKPQVILGSLPSPELCLAGANFAKKYGIAFIADIRDPWPDIFLRYFPFYLRWIFLPVVLYYRRTVAKIMASSDGIVAVSRAMLDWGIGYSGRQKSNRDKVFYIGYNRRDAERAIEVPPEFNRENPLVCLFASTCGNSYDGVTVIQAARILEERGESRLSFIITGEGECRKEWEFQARGLSSVKFTGWITNAQLQELFLRSHAGLIIMRGGITSFWLGNKFAEYLSTYLLLVNNVPGESAQITASLDLGVNIAPNDAAALAAALAGLAGSPERVRTLMENSRKAFLDEFERSKIYDGYVKYLAGFIQPQ